MAPSGLPLALALLGAVTRVRAHGIATALVQWPAGIFYAGYNPSYQYSHPPPVVVGWSTPDDLTNTFVSPSSYSSADISCHIKATPAGAEAPITAGDVLAIQWNKWPESHHGPVLDYLANCNGPCENADKTKLKFFKIDEAGLLDVQKKYWAADELLKNNLTWFVKIPTDITPGNYVLRHEMIALHAAGNANGAQNYPFCFSLAISSQGTKNPDGLLATELYKATDPGILFDLFRPYSTYVIPGPSLYAGALSVAQSMPVKPKTTASGIASYVAVAAAAAGATPPPAAGGAATPSTTAAAATTSAKAAPTTASFSTTTKTPGKAAGGPMMPGMPTGKARTTSSRHFHREAEAAAAATTLAKVKRDGS